MAAVPVRNGPYARLEKTYRAEETEVPAAAKTVAISACAKEMKHCTTAESNCGPLDSIRRRTASS